MADLKFDATPVLTLRRVPGLALLDAEVSVLVDRIEAADSADDVAQEAFLALCKPLAARDLYGNPMPSTHDDLNYFPVGRCFFKLCKTMFFNDGAEAQEAAYAAFLEFDSSSQSAAMAMENLADGQPADFVEGLMVGDEGQTSMLGVLEGFSLHPDFEPADILWAAHSALLPLTGPMHGMLVMGSFSHGKQSAHAELELRSEMRGFDRDELDWRMSMKPCPEGLDDGFWFLTGLADTGYLGEPNEVEPRVRARDP